MAKPVLIASIAFTFAVLLAPFRVTAVTEASSPRIWIHAQFYPGGDSDGPPDPWELTITNCGDAMQQTFIFSTEGNRKRETISKRFAFSPQDIDELIAMVKDTKFFDLPEEISDGSFQHCATIELRIVMDGKTQFSSFNAPNKKEDKAALLRFWKVWSAILKKVPSPNKDGDLTFWLRHNHPELLHGEESSN